MTHPSTRSCRWRASPRPASPRWSRRRFAIRASACRSPASASSDWSARRSRPSLLWNHNTSSFGVVAADNFGLFVTGMLIVVGLLSLAISGPTIERERLPRRRVLRADAVRDRRHDADGDGDRSAGHLPRARGAVARGLRADRHPPRLAGVDRSGVQVLPARRILERLLSLRHRVHLRPDRQHAARPHRQPDGGAGDGADADAVPGARPADRRLRVQGVGGAVPHVDARRLRGRAAGGHRRSCRPA